jgi:drug/metabolite transporter (DMT)-like permease
MSKRFVISIVVMFVATMLAGLVVHGMLLHNDYLRLTPNLFRGEADAQKYFPFMLLAHLFLAIGWTWIYRQGRETGKPWLMQGVRFGLAVAVISSIPMYLIYYAVQPMPADLVAQQIVYDTITCILLGIVAAAVNRDPRA